MSAGEFSGTMNQRRMLAAMIVACIVVSATTIANAAVVVSESFDYGAVNGELEGNNGGTGWGGAWQETSQNFGADFGDANYQAAGLTFGSLQVSGGSALLNGHNARAITTRTINASVTGTLYGSYLFRNVSSSRLIALLGHNQASEKNDDNTDFYSAGHGFDSARGAGRLHASVAYNTGSNTAVGTTYLNLFRLTNVGTTNQQTLTSYVLTEAQFENFVLGGLTDAELDAAGTGTAATQVLNKGSVSYTPANAADVQFVVGNFLSLFVYGSTDFSAQFDELRISNASLNETVPVPEPASLALLGVGGLLMSVRAWGRRDRASRCMRH